MHYWSVLVSMVLVRSGRLVPPRDLLTTSDSIVVVSNRRPVCVYFERVMEVASKKIFGHASGTSFDIVITGAGAAISRCEQISRYLVQELKTKYKHLLKSVTKQKIVESTQTTDLSIPDMTDGSTELELVLNTTSTVRHVPTASIKIQVVLS